MIYKKLNFGEEYTPLTSSELTGDSSATASNETHVSEAAEMPSQGRESGGSAIVHEPMLTSNLAAKPDSYDMYKHLMEVQVRRVSPVTSISILSLEGGPNIRAIGGGRPWSEDAEIGPQDFIWDCLARY